MAIAVMVSQAQRLSNEGKQMSFCEKQLSEEVLVGAQGHLVCATFDGETDQIKGRAF
jgi:hypothetical protein